jgi:hypothetical protein
MVAFLSDENEDPLRLDTICTPIPEWKKHDRHQSKWNSGTDGSADQNVGKGQADVRLVLDSHK